MITLELPLRLVSEANQRGWSHKAQRAKGQRGPTKLALQARFGTIATDGHVVVTLTRIGPRLLDDDNLASSAKAVRDGVADWLGIDDGDAARVSWRYAQEAVGVRRYGVRIDVEVVR
jgi:hypothetical protein